MIHRLRVVGLLLALAVPAPAHAVVLDSWGILAIRIAALPEVEIPAAGLVPLNGSSGGGHLTSLSLVAGFFASSGYRLPVAIPGQPVSSIQFTGSAGPGQFAGSGGSGFGGVMPIGGVAKACLFGPCSAAVANLVVPLGMAGAGGTVFATGQVNATVVGAPWTTGTVAIGTATSMGSAGPASSTAAPGGRVSLVTPVFVSTNIPDLSILPVFGRFELHFVPEAGTLVLLGIGVAALTALGRKRLGAG